jgi:hypothetical protein
MVSMKDSCLGHKPRIENPNVDASSLYFKEAGCHTNPPN